MKLNLTIRDYNKIIDTFLIKKRMSETKDFSKTAMTINFWVMIGSVMLSIFMFLMIYNDVDNFAEIYIWLPLPIVMVSIIIVLVILAKSILKKNREIDVDYEIQSHLEK